MKKFFYRILNDPLFEMACEAVAFVCLVGLCAIVYIVCAASEGGHP